MAIRYASKENLEEAVRRLRSEQGSMTLEKVDEISAKSGIGVNAMFAGGNEESVARVINMAQQGTIDLAMDCGWAIGNQMPIKLSNGKNVTVALVDNKPYAPTDKSRKASFTWVMTSNPFGDRVMNDTNVMVGGWKNAKLRDYIQKNVLLTLPQWLQDATLEASVVCDTGYGGSGTATVNDKLWIPTEFEVKGNHVRGVSPAIDGEHRLLGYENGSVKITGTTWTRTASSESSNKYVWVANSSSGTQDVNSACGIRVCGCF